jgi:type IV secretory pathway VirB3-like protein
MIDKADLYHAPLFVALTRAPMLMGVTQTFFVLNLGISMILFLVTKKIIWVGLLFCALHVIGVLGCHEDERFFEMWLGKLGLVCPNRYFW